MTFNLNSEFFHLKLGGSRCLVLSMLPPRMGPAVMEGGGGGGQQAPCLVAKQAVECPQVLASSLLLQHSLVLDTTLQLSKSTLRSK